VTSPSVPQGNTWVVLQDGDTLVGELPRAEWLQQKRYVVVPHDLLDGAFFRPRAPFQGSHPLPLGRKELAVGPYPLHPVSLDGAQRV
jgi:hypothetical protein